MAQKKLYRFAQLKTFPNVFENPAAMKGKWSEYFRNDNPLVLELACGRGEYTIGLSRMHPQKNHIGIDIKGNRMYIGAKIALEEGLTNAAFVRTQVEKIPECFGKDEVDEIWITFPDPQLRISKAKKRLTHPRFLRLYQHILKPDASIHLKTDSPDLFEFTMLVIDMYGLNLITSSDNVYGGEVTEELQIKTHYEKMDIAGSNKIHHLEFTLPPNIPDNDLELKKLLVHE